MLVNTARTVSEALFHGLHNLRVNGIRQESRVGDVLVAPQPVMTVYTHPANRVLFSTMRDANPFFHVMESLWMLAGRNDLPWLTEYNKRMAAYSDDGGQTQPGAYGYRWREHFGYDQLETIIVELANNPMTRRCVLAMWDGGNANENPIVFNSDLYNAIGGSADVPCNTHIYFDASSGKLNMTVCCRSNDIIWGAHGANAVHFSFLLEYVSARTGLPMGSLYQFSNNYHLYTNVVPEGSIMPMAREVLASDIYTEGKTSPVLVDISPRVPLVTVGETVPWEEDLQKFMSEEYEGFSHRFFSCVAQPMRLAWRAHKDRDYEAALSHARSIVAYDWQVAAVDWIRRRKIKHEVNTAPFTEVVERKS